MRCVYCNHFRVLHGTIGICIMCLKKLYEEVNPPFKFWDVHYSEKMAIERAIPVIEKFLEAETS